MTITNNSDFGNFVVNPSCCSDPRVRCPECEAKAQMSSYGNRLVSPPSTLTENAHPGLQPHIKREMEFVPGCLLPAVSPPNIKERKPIYVNGRQVESPILPLPEGTCHRGES